MHYSHYADCIQEVSKLNPNVSAQSDDFPENSLLVANIQGEYAVVVGTSLGLIAQIGTGAHPGLWVEVTADGRQVSRLHASFDSLHEKLRLLKTPLSKNSLQESGSEQQAG